MTPLENRFWSKVDQSGGPHACWPWTAGLQKAGYGIFSISTNGVRKLHGSHRLAWELTNGKPVPDGMFACHICDNRACCNPSHIYPGTPAQNMADKLARGRDRSQTTTTCFAGHEYTPENTMLITGTHWKRCRTCFRAKSREASARYRLRRAAAQNERRDAGSGDPLR